MSNPKFVYVTYIQTTPEELWRALTEPAFTRRYWGLAHETDWQPGSTMIWERPDGTRQSDPEQVVLQADPYRRLSYAWHAFTPEWNSTVGLSDDVQVAIAAEPRSHVSFEIEPHGELVKLTVVHDNFASGSTMADMVSNGWPLVLSSLKTLLEAGDTRSTLG
jgi:uncharacterized protein YndB with AHSA1/START domain